jgi:hypothetical protein
MRTSAFILLILAAVAVAHDGPHPAANSGSGQQPQSKVSITVEGDYRLITANGVPDHPSGHRNPGRVEAQEYSFRVPLNPKPAATATYIRHSPFGVAINGVVFDPSTNEYWNSDRRWMIEALTRVDLGTDANHAHVQPGGKYHYHGLPTALLDRLEAKKKMTLVGYAADGFPIYGPMAYSDPNDPSSPLKAMKPSYTVKTGARPAGQDGPGGKYDGMYFPDWTYEKGLGDLDDCNGRTGVTPEYPKGTYYYVLTDTYPFVPRYWRGTPDPSFVRRPPQNGQGPGGQGPGGQRPEGPPPGGRPPRRP